MRCSSLLLLGACFLGWAGGARANSVFVLEPSSGAAAPGAAVNVNVYLRLDGAELTTVVNDHGLQSAGVELRLDSTTTSHSALITNVTGNSLFDDPFSPTVNWHSATNAGTTVSVVDFMSLLGSSGLMPSAPDISAGVWKVQLGTFAITASPDVGQVSVFKAFAVSPNTTVTFDNLTSVDPSGSPSFSIQSVPLPSSVWGGVALLAVLAGFRLIRRRAIA